MAALFKETNCFKLYEVTDFFHIKVILFGVTWIQPLAFVKGTFSYIEIQFIYDLAPFWTNLP